MDEKTFEMVDGILGTQGYHDDREAAVSILEVGAKEGTLGEAAQVVADRYALQPRVVLEWFAEVIMRRLLETAEIVEKLKEATKGHV